MRRVDATQSPAEPATQRTPSDRARIGRRRWLRAALMPVAPAIAAPAIAAPAGNVSEPVRAAQDAPAALPMSGASAGPDGAPTKLPKVIVLNSRDASVSLIDQARFVEEGRVAVGKEPHHLYPTPDGRGLIVASAASDELYFLDPIDGRILSRLRQIEDPYQLAFSPDQRWFVTAALRLDRVDVYRYRDGAKQVAARIPLSKMPSHLWFSADNRHVFVTLQGSREIAAIDVEEGRLLWRLEVGQEPAGIVMSPDDQHLFVGIMGEDGVDVVDWRARRKVARIRTGNGAHNFRGVGDQRHLLVSNRVAGTISVIDMLERKVVDEVRAVGGPDCMEMAADGRTLWVTARWIKQVLVLDLPSRAISRRIPVGRSPHGVYLHNRAAVI